MKNKNQQGFTIIELVAVMIIIAVISAIAAPTFLDYIRNQRLKGATRELYSALMNARMMAVSENRNIFVQFVSNHQYCFVRDMNGSKTIDSGDKAGAIMDIHHDYPDITFSANVNPVFRPNGTGKNLTITMSSSSTAQKNRITISSAGRIRIFSCP